MRTILVVDEERIELEGIKLDERDREEEIRQKENKLLWELILYQLINGISLKAIQERADYHLSNRLVKRYHRMILIDSNHNFFEKGNEVLAERLKKNFHTPFDYLNINMQQSVLFFERRVTVDYEVLARSIYEFIKKIYQEECYLAVSRSFENVSEITEVFKQLEELMEEKFYQPVDHVFLLRKNISNSFTTESEEELIRLIHEDIQNKNIESLKKNYGSLCNKYQEKTDFSQIYIKFVFSNLIKDICMVLSVHNKIKIEKEIEELYKCTKIKDVIELSNHYIERFIKSCKDQGIRTEIQAIKNYIYENYQKDISIQMLAEKVCLTPSYVSYIFKKETGCNLNKFMKTYRMNKAKELLKCTQMKIVDICELVGYTNVSYFCQNFKESFGLSPEKFRQTAEVKEEEKTI